MDWRAAKTWRVDLVRPALVILLAPSSWGAMPLPIQVPSRNSVRSPITSRTIPPSPPAKTRRLPAEEERLSVNVFREGLRKRGLIELLELHLREFPPAETVEAMLSLRALKLALFADPRRPQAERWEAVAQANALLEQLITEYPADPRRWPWLFELAHSLLYDEGERYTAKLMYRESGTSDQLPLRQTTNRALTAARTLHAELAAEFDRVDNLDVARYDRLEQSGHIDRIDRLAPRAEYLLLWSLYFDALARPRSDQIALTRLAAILDMLRTNESLRETPHAISRVQIQTLLLEGMTRRRSGDDRGTRETLERALNVYTTLTDSAERERVRWSAVLAHLELVRSARDAGRFQDAQQTLDRFQSFLTQEQPENFELRLLSALTEQSIYKSWTAHSSLADRPQEKIRLLERATALLAQFLEQDPDRRDEVYAALFDRLDPAADPRSFDPLDQVAALAGWIRAAIDRPGEAPVLLERAFQAGRSFLERNDSATRWFRPEVLFNIGVVEYRRDRPVNAARFFLQLATDHPQFQQAPQAAVAAVRLTAEALANPNLEEPVQVRDLYRRSLESLFALDPQSDAAKYWRFFYAQLLDELGQHAAAANLYSQVGPEHPQARSARFLRWRSLARTLNQQPTDSTPQWIRTREQCAALVAELQAFLREENPISSPEVPSGNPDLDAVHILDVRLLLAEIFLYPCADLPTRTLETLSDFEHRFPSLRDHDAARLWKLRLIAYQRLGRLDDAAQTIPTLVQADPGGAGPVLQNLFDSTVAPLGDVLLYFDGPPDPNHAEIALLLAEQIVNWTMKHPPADPNRGDSLLRQAKIQYAESLMRVGRLADARHQWTNLIPDKEIADQPLTDELDLRVKLGLAESLFHLDQWGKALPHFNQLATSLPRDAPYRWKALLRDLQCRTRLQHDPQGILKVIHQQRYLDPGLGGPDLIAQFDRLDRENQRRLATEHK